MAKVRELPPPLEMACLNALWELGEANVEEVRVSVSCTRPLAYTTVLTLLDRLSRRGAVSRRKEGRSFRYQPAIERNKLRKLALGHFLDHHFGGSITNLRMFLDVEMAGLPQQASGQAESPQAGGSANVDADAGAQAAWANASGSPPRSET